MRRLLQFALLASLAVAASAQRQNVRFAAEYPGATVAARVTAAQADCNPNASIPCVIVIDATLATASEGTLPTPCAQCIWKDYRVAGSERCASNASPALATCGGGAGGGLSILNKQDPGGALTGDGTDQTVYTYSMPGGTLAAGKCVRISFFSYHSTGSVSVTEKVFFGATSVGQVATGLSGAEYVLRITVCNNAASTTAQWGHPEALFAGTGLQNFVGNFSTPAENAANPIIIKGTFNVAATDQVTGKGWVVELLP